MRTVTIVLLIAATFSAQANPTVQDFLKDPDVIAASLSPDGKHLAIILNQDGRRVVAVRNTESPELPLIGAFSETEIKAYWVGWGNNDRVLISLRVPYNLYAQQHEHTAYQEGGEGYTFSRMLSSSLDLSDQVVLMENQRHLKQYFSLTRISDYADEDPRHILMNGFSQGKRTLYKVDLYTGKSKLITRGSPRTYAFDSDKSGMPHLRFDHRESDQAIEIFEYQDSDEWKLAETISISANQETSGGFNDPVFLNQEHSVFRKLNDSTGFYELISRARDTGKLETLAAIDGQDLADVVTAPRIGDVIGYQVEKDYSRNHYFDSKHQERYDAIAERIGNNNFVVSTLSPDADKALVVISGPDTPKTYYLWNHETQLATYLGSAFQHLTPDNLAAPAMVKYKARDGSPIRAYILLPRSFESGKAHPTVIFPHGGPQSRSRAEYDHFAQFMATRGYIVVMPNFRGSTGYGRDFEEAGYLQWGGLMQDDLTDAANFMISKGYSDPERMCIVGFSYGGYAALMGAIKTPDLFQCAISMNGVTDLIDQIEYDMKEVVEKPEWDTLLYKRIGHPKEQREMLEAASPTHNADKISIPVLIMAGTDDERIPHEQSEKMVKAMEKAGVEHEFISVESTGHYLFDDRLHSDTIYLMVEDFLRTHLQRER